MRILLLANSDIGLYKFRMELLEALLEEGHAVYISVPRGQFTDEIEAMGCRIFDVSLSRHGTSPLEDWKLYQSYLRLMQDLRPDVVLTYTIKPNIYGGMAAAKWGIPYVENITGLGTAVETPGPLQVLTLGMYHFGLRKVQTVFFQNEANARFFADHHLGAGRQKRLPGSGVNLQAYPYVPMEKKETTDFLFVARIMKEKGIEQYIQAAKIIQKKYPHTRFHICGFCEQDYEQEIEDLHKQGIVIYHGMVKDMKPLYAMADCTVHPTYYPEGLSNVLLESAATGRPLITTRRPGCREVVDEGKNGFLVPEQDGEALVQAIERFLLLSRSEKEAMGTASRQKVEREFSRDLVIQAYMRELDIVAAKKRNAWQNGMLRRPVLFH